MSQIYSKTAKGQDEVKTRAGGLTQRMRQVLIFIDGKRSRDDLYGMLKGEDLDELLHTFVAQGLIEVTGNAADKAPPKPAAPSAAPTPTVAAAPVQKAEAPKLTPEEIEKQQREQEREAELAMARSFMGKMS